MSTPPRDRSEFWVRFGCSFLFFGFLLALVSVWFWHDLGLQLSCALWLVATIGVSIYASLRGDEAWEKAVHLLAKLVGHWLTRQKADG